MYLIVWSLAAYGLTLIITQSKIMAPIRGLFNCQGFFGKLIHCPMCVGFWIGIFLSLLRFSPTALFLHYPSKIWTPQYIFDGFVSSAACWIIYVVLSKMGAREL